MEKFYTNYQSELQTLKAWDKEEEFKAQAQINKEEVDAWKKEARAEFQNYSSFFREYYGE